MNQRQAAWLIVRQVPKGLAVAFVTLLLYGIAIVLSWFGSTSLREDMSGTFRRWYIFPPKTPEEKAERIVAYINLRRTLLGFGPAGFLRHMIWRITGRKLMGHYLQGKLKELQNTNLATYASLSDTELVINATSMLDKFLAMALIAKFSGTLSRTQYESIFEGHGALSGFAELSRVLKTPS